jgi:hypothetical protein
MSNGEIESFNNTCDSLSKNMTAEEACVHLAQKYSPQEKMAFMMGSALTISLMGDGLLKCPSVEVIPKNELYDEDDMFD